MHRPREDTHTRKSIKRAISLSNIVVCNVPRRQDSVDEPSSQAPQSGVSAEACACTCALCRCAPAYAARLEHTPLLPEPWRLRPWTLERSDVRCPDGALSCREPCRCAYVWHSRGGDGDSGSCTDMRHQLRELRDNEQLRAAWRPSPRGETNVAGCSIARGWGPRARPRRNIKGQHPSPSVHRGRATASSSLLEFIEAAKPCTLEASDDDPTLTSSARC